MRGFSAFSRSKTGELFQIALASLLNIQNVSLMLGGQSILESINLELKERFFLGIIGPNGGGKTMLLRLILGLIEPTHGVIAVLGEKPGRTAGRVSYVPQFAPFSRDFPITVYDVALQGRLSRKSLCRGYTKVDHEKVRNVLALVEIQDLAEKHIRELSGGQLQRLLVARALASDPELLLMDEPTASLDPKVGTNLYSLLDRLAEKMSIILVSHDIGVISSHVKTVACLNKTLHYHDTHEIPGDTLAEVYGCPVELIAHGHAHRVFKEH